MIRVSITIFLHLLVSGALAQGTTIDSLETLLPTAKDTARVNLLNKLSSLNAKKDTKKSLVFAEEALALSEKLDFEFGVAQSSRAVGFAWFFNNDHQKAIDYLLQSAIKARSIQKWSLEAQNYLNIGGTYYGVMGNYTKAMDYYLKALKVYETHNIDTKVYDAYAGIAAVYNHQKEYEKALDYYEKSLKLLETKKDMSALGITAQNIANLYLNTGRISEAEKYYVLSLANFKEAKIRGGTIITLTKLSDIFRLRQEFDKAMKNDLEAYALSEKSTYDRERFYPLESLGKTYLGKKEYEKSKTYFESAVAFAQRSGMVEKLSETYQSLAELSVLTNDFERAYTYQKLHSLYADSVKSKEGISQLAEMEVRFETDRKDKENLLLKKDNDLNKLYAAIASVSLISFITIAALFFNRQRIKTESAKAVSESEKKLLEAELKNTRLSEAQLRTDIDFKNKELTTYALSMVQKNEILEEVRENVELILKKTDNYEEHFKKLSKIVGYGLSLEKDWDEFKIYFENVHRDFFAKLKEQFPDLSSTDMKLCALIKLNLNIKQAAAILRISPDSVKIARHRLRKKFNMQTEDNLNEFIMVL